ncbi:MAG: pyridoxal-phosphate dependent enzyme [Desulfobacterota bacterium]|nr:pyridoxal-phosphate dependent enzyme [Thermodesulfobacteriota bacterium]
MIDLTIHEEPLKRTVQRLRERGIVLPTFRQQKNPEEIPPAIKDRLKEVGLWDLHPYNLFRITWKNEPVDHGGGFGDVNVMEIPIVLSGVEARILALIGKWFPTGSHKVGATYGCLIPRLVTGQFDPTRHKAVWPSTGNFCRGGAYNAALLGCESIAILPEGMSRERFEWLSKIAGEVLTTPGGESNVKEIFDKCKELQRTRKDLFIFNQFEEFGNHLWHYEVTGQALEEALRQRMTSEDRFAGFVASSGSAGTLGAGDYLKKVFPGSRLAVGEPLQCPTLLCNGYGDHRIEGIGDKHVPWIHHVRNTDMVIAVDDQACLDLIRLFNEPKGIGYLKKEGVDEKFLSKLPLLGISSVANLLCAIKFAKYYGLGRRDFIATVFTDSIDLYRSRLKELEEKYGPYTEEEAVKDYHRVLMGTTTDHLLELSYREKKRIHNLKYFTWIEQQGKDPSELEAQWEDDPFYWENLHAQAKKIDDLIDQFNRLTGLRP